jgi:endonuclease/exonuclease/phosphatase family metal-dependent hydrolase
VGQKLRVLSANLYNGRAEPRAFADLVAAMNVDVVAVQECGPAQAEVLTEVMPYGLLHPSDQSMGMGLVLRRPCEVHMLELSYRAAYRVRLDPADWPELSRPAEVLNVHFAAPHVYRPVAGLSVRPSQMRDFLGHLNIGAPARAPQAEGEPEAPQRIVVGDFNATPIWPLYWRMSSQFTDAALAVARQSGRRAQRTWGPWFGAPRLLRIDHGFVTKGMRVDEFQAVPVIGSDHSAIVMDVLLD